VSAKGTKGREGREGVQARSASVPSAWAAPITFHASRFTRPRAWGWTVGAQRRCAPTKGAKG